MQRASVQNTPVSFPAVHLGKRMTLRTVTLTFARLGNAAAPLRATTIIIIIAKIIIVRNPIVPMRRKSGTSFVIFITKYQALQTSEELDIAVLRYHLSIPLKNPPGLCFWPGGFVCCFLSKPACVYPIFAI